MNKEIIQKQLDDYGCQFFKDGNQVDVHKLIVESFCEKDGYDGLWIKSICVSSTDQKAIGAEYYLDDQEKRNIVSFETI